MGNFILLVNDSYDSDDRKVSAYDLALARLKDKSWPIYQRTPNRNQLNSGSRCLIYIAGYGENAQHIIGEMIVSDRLTSNMQHITTYDLDICNGLPSYYLKSKKVFLFNEPISIKSKIDNLSFIKSKEISWGIYLQSGCKSISDSDYNLLKPKSQKTLK